MAGGRKSYRTENVSLHELQTKTSDRWDFAGRRLRVNNSDAKTNNQAWAGIFWLIWSLFLCNHLTNIFCCEYFVIISMLPGQGDMRGWSQALWLLGQKWRMQEESWMVYFKCLIALFACHYWNFDITTQKLITSTRSIYFPLVEAPLFISFTFHFRMLVSCPVSCNQCKNKCDDNNVYCKVTTSHYMKNCFLNHS